MLATISKGVSAAEVVAVSSLTTVKTETEVVEVSDQSYPRPKTWPTSRVEDASYSFFLRTYTILRDLFAQEVETVTVEMTEVVETETADVMIVTGKSNHIIFVQRKSCLRLENLTGYLHLCRSSTV